MYIYEDGKTQNYQIDLHFLPERRGETKEGLTLEMQQYKYMIFRSMQTTQ